MAALRTIPDTTCPQCGVVFRPKRADQQYCSRACWTAASKSKPGICKSCGAEFKKRYSGQQYCSVECKNKGLSVDKNCTCAFCGTSFERPHGKTRAYCSHKCAMDARKAKIAVDKQKLEPRAPGTGLTTHGYKYIRLDSKKVLEHRHLMEQHMGRKLLKNEYVHHKNGVRTDNRLENLEVWASKKDPKGQRVVDIAKDIVPLLSAEEKQQLIQALQN